MSKFQKIALAVGAAVAAAIPFAGMAFAADPDYTITATDTIPVFKAGAAALKDNGLAVLNVAVPWLAGALVALTIVYIFYRVFRHFRA